MDKLIDERKNPLTLDVVKRLRELAATDDDESELLASIYGGKTYACMRSFAMDICDLAIAALTEYESRRAGGQEPVAKPDAPDEAQTKAAAQEDGRLCNEVISGVASPESRPVAAAIAEVPTPESAALLERILPLEDCERITILSKAIERFESQRDEARRELAAANAKLAEFEQEPSAWRWEFREDDGELVAHGVCETRPPDRDGDTIYPLYARKGAKHGS